MNDQRLAKLREALTQSLSRMKKFAEYRHEAYKQYVGKHYSGDGTTSAVPLPFIAQAISIILRSLVSSEPQGLVECDEPDLRADAYSFELGLNRLLEDMDFGRTLKTWVLESMMSPFGIIKVSLDVDDVEDLEGFQAWTGRPLAEPVLWDDWVHDMSARSMDKIGYCGHRYSIPKDTALASGLYDPDVVARIHKPERVDEHSTQNLSGVRQPWDEDYREMIELWDIWLPHEGQVVTLTKDFADLPPLRVVEWNGPRKGPFHFLWFNPVPGSTMPLPPVALWRDLHDLANKLFNKLARQALRQKKMVTVPSSAVKDGNKLAVAGTDGEAIIADNAESVKEVSFGGIDQSNFGYVMQLKQLHSYYAGNLDVLGGLAPQSGTVGQDALLSESAGQSVRAMQEEVDKRVAEVMEAIGHFMWNDPINQIPITKQIAGTQETVQTYWTSAEMRGDAYQYKIRIVPHSVRRKSPEERKQEAIALVERVLIPLVPVMQASGQAINGEAVWKYIARLSGDPNLAEFVTYAQGESMPKEDTGPPKTTTRQYVRASRTEKTPVGQEQQLIAKLMSQGDAA